MYYPYGYTLKRTVARVIDGDTFVLTDSEHVRMLGINTPELARFGNPAEPYADSAKILTTQLINGKTIRLTFDGKSFGIFGRLLAYVWLTNIHGKDSVFVQAELLKKGYARISYYPKGMRYYAIFYNLRRTAMKKNLGIWNK
jgi:micrococcal nuclease